MKTPAFLPHILSLLVILVFSTGCETTSSKSKTPPPEAFSIKRGDSVMTLIEQMGEPEKKSVIEKSGSTGSIWTYQHKMRSKTRMVPTGTQDVEVYDHLNNRSTTVQEVTYTQEFSYLTQVTEFLVMDGTVISWKQRIDDDKTRIE